MDTRAWAIATAVSAARALDECAKAFLRAGDMASAQQCCTAAKAAHRAADSLKEGLKNA